MTCAGGSGATPSRAAAHPTKSQFAAQAHDARELYRDLWPARACEGGKTTASGVKESTDTCLHLLPKRGVHSEAPWDESWEFRALFGFKP